MKIDGIEAYLLEITRELIGYLIRRGATPEDAQDISQDTLLKILEIEDVLAFQQLRPWLYRVGINRFIDVYRQKQRQKAILEQNFRQLLPKEELQTDYQLIYQQFTQLDILSQTLLLMKYDEGRSIKEIAFLLDRPEDSIKTSLYRSRQKLRMKMEEGENDGR